MGAYGFALTSLRTRSELLFFGFLSQLGNGLLHFFASKSQFTTHALVKKEKERRKKDSFFFFRETSAPPTSSIPAPCYFYPTQLQPRSLLLGSSLLQFACFMFADTYTCLFVFLRMQSRSKTPRHDGADCGYIQPPSGFLINDSELHATELLKRPPVRL